MFDEIGQDIEALFDGFEFSNTLRCSSVNNVGIRVTAEGILSTSENNVSSLSMSQEKPRGSLVVENLSITNEGRVSGEFSIKSSEASKLYLSAQMRGQSLAEVSSRRERLEPSTAHRL